MAARRRSKSGTGVVTQSGRDRLIGAVFVLAVAGIVLPMLLDGEGVPDLAELQVDVDEVERPPISPIPIEDEQWRFVDQAAELHQRGPTAVESDEFVPRLGQPRELEDDAEHSPGTLPWTIQLASFSQRDNGLTLKDTLQRAGYHAYMTDGTNAKGEPLVRVSVGPIRNHDEASRVQQELQQRFQLTGVLRRFDL